MAGVLLVDDDPAVVASNAAALEARGHDVLTAANTSAAKAAVLRLEPDVVVLEAMLDGGFAGFELARDFAGRFPSMPLIMLSRVDEHLHPDELAEQDHDRGWLPVRRFMEKPVLPEVLAYEVEHVLPAVD
jgi:DNA-binding response OmpR family regulator